MGMEDHRKTVLSIVIFLTVYSLAISGQIKVGGEIYSNRIWTKNSSPYIITANVVVLPGVTLTIQPGVIIKFADNTQLEIQQASLIALGSLTDSIKFTSNSSSPTAGIWNQIYVNGGNMPSKFSYCIFQYANKAINGVSDSLSINNSSFNFNNSGVSIQSDTTHEKKNAGALDSNKKTIDGQELPKTPFSAWEEANKNSKF